MAASLYFFVTETTAASSKINDLPYLSCRIDLHQLSKAERPANPFTTLSAMPVDAVKRVR
jgi:hypothetical protein